MTEIEFTDEKIDELLKAEPEEPIPIEKRHPLFVYYAPTAKTFASALATSHFSHQTTLPRDSSSLYLKLLRTASDEGLKKLIARNPSIAVSSFSTLCEIRRKSIVKWIFANRFVPPDKMLRDLIQFGYEEEALEIYNDADIRPVTLHLCLREEIYKADQSKFFEMILRDPRCDPSDFDNTLLSAAVFRGKLSVVLRLLQEQRVQECKNWYRVVESACRQTDPDLLRLIMEQPNARMTRRAALNLDDQNSETYQHQNSWVYDHPKCRPNIGEPFNVKSLTRRAVVLLERKEGDKAKKLLEIALSILDKELEASDDDDLLDYNDEKKCEELFND